MEALKAYLKSLGNEEERKLFAEACGTSLGHLRNCIYDGEKRLSTDTCVLIEKISGVSRRNLRPDWHRHWPELVDKKHPAPKSAPQEPARA